MALGGIMPLSADRQPPGVLVDDADRAAMEAGERLFALAAAHRYLVAARDTLTEMQDEIARAARTMKDLEWSHGRLQNGSVWPDRVTVDEQLDELARRCERSSAPDLAESLRRPGPRRRRAAIGKVRVCTWGAAMSTANPRHHDAWLPVTLKSGTWDAQAHYHAVQARLADLDALAQATTDPFVHWRVVIDQAVDLRRALLDQAEQARRTSGSPAWTHSRLRRDHGHWQVFLAVLESVPRARSTGAVLTAALDAAAGVVRPLAGALVDQPDLREVAVRSVATCMRLLLIADHVITTGDTMFRRR